MIVDDRNKFIFIHIPKCGGSSLRQLLASHDSTQGFFTGRVAPLAPYDLVDHVHLPLPVLRKHFPDIFAKLETYKSFAMTRDPLTRFASALGQWFKNTCHVSILECRPEEVAAGARVVLDQLLDDPATLAPKLIHFRPQRDFILLEGDRVVKRLYRIEEIDQELTDIAAYLGIELGAAPRANPAMYYRNHAVKAAVSMLRPVAFPLWNILPVSTKERIYYSLMRPRGEEEPILRGTPLTVLEVLDQAGLLSEVRDFYDADFALLDRCETRQHE